MLTVEFIDRAPTVRFYDHTRHISAAVCCETSLHALTDGRRHDHREGCEDVVYRGREGVTLSGRELNHGSTHMAGRRRLLFLITCSDDSKPHMILVALIKGFRNYIGFAIIRSSGEE